MSDPVLFAPLERLHRLACAEQPTISSAPFYEWRHPDGTVSSQFYHADSRYLLRFPGLADFTVSADGQEVAVCPTPEASEPDIQHLYLNQVLPLAYSRQYKLILHASAVEVAQCAIAFLGESGRGKSTLAASFSTGGYRFLTDDGLHVENSQGGYFIQPSHPSIRLWDDSRVALIPESEATPSMEKVSKVRLLAGAAVSFCDVPRLLQRVYFLGEDEVGSITIEPVSGRDAMLELVKNSFLLDIDARDMLTHHFCQLVEMVKTPMFYRLNYPREYEMLPKVREAVINHAATLGKR